MSYKHCCVVDADGNYKDFVLVLLAPTEDGDIKEEIQYYALKDGDTLVDALPPTSTVKPRWDGTGWVETATPDEIAAANPPPTAAQQIASLKAQLTATDYQAIKYAEGWLTAEEYEPIKAQRQAWRDEINRLESEIILN